MTTAGKFLLLTLLAVSATEHLSAQTSANAQSVAGTWLVTVQGIPDNETRTLIISSETPAPTTGDLAARYGLTSKTQTPVEARLTPSRSPRQLVVVTQAAARLTADETQDGTFTGSFVTKNGASYAVTVERVTPERLAELRANAVPPPSKKDPLAEVPLSPSTAPACAAFHGSWRGSWSQGGFADVPLKEGLHNTPSSTSLRQ